MPRNMDVGKKIYTAKPIGSSDSESLANYWLTAMQRHVRTFRGESASQLISDAAGGSGD